MAEEIKNNINLKVIKSRYIMKEVLLFLPKRPKLKMIIHNKELQNLLLVDINDYKKASGKYRIIKKNGEGEEYIIDSTELKSNYYKKRIFSGNYKNGKRDGKGKEYYDNGELKFEGEYLNGERNGKGTEYYNMEEIIFNKRKFKFNYIYFNKILKFEGEYLNGKRNGNGKEYNCEGELEFEGKYLNGKRWNGKGYNKNRNESFELQNGKGNNKEYDFNTKLLFEGDFLNGEWNGNVKEYFIFKNKFQLYFEGEYLNGKRWKGNGYNKNNQMIFKIQNGKGYIREYNFNDAIIFEGKYLNG